MDEDAFALTAPSLYAIANSKVCAGPDNCHWCGAHCERLLPHGDKRSPMAVGKHPYARFPNNNYQCIGCWLFGRKLVTTFILGGGLKDSQDPSKHSWWITTEGSWTVRIPQDAAALYKVLLRPPMTFVCSLLEGPNSPPNRLQTALANNHKEIKASTPLTFTINGVPYCYSVYELEEALTSPGDLAGMLPGVRELIRLLGPYKELEDSAKKGKGRPAGTETLPNTAKKIVTAEATSGFPMVPSLKV